MFMGVVVQPLNSKNRTSCHDIGVTLISNLVLRAGSRWSWVREGTVEDSPGHCLPLLFKKGPSTEPTSSILDANLFWRELA